MKHPRACTHMSNARMFICSLLWLTAAVMNAQTVPDPATLVDPLIGSANLGYTFPGAVLPFGMVSFSPEELAPAPTKRNTPGGYLYEGSIIRGFSLTHLSGAGCAGSGDVLFMPITHGVSISPALDIRSSAYTSEFSHAEEHAAAGFYSVRLNNGVIVELSATPRTGIARFTYPPGHDSFLLIRSSDNDVGSTDSSVSIDPQRSRISGSLTSGDFCWIGGPPDSKPYYKIYFVAYFDEPFLSYGTWQDKAVNPQSLTASGGTSMVLTHTSTYSVPAKGSGAYVSFKSDGMTTNMRVGISFVSQANAEANLIEENGMDGNFDSVRTNAHAAWKHQLSSISINGGTTSDQAVFYTALYHSLLFMNIASDVNGQYMGMDGEIHSVRAPQKTQYANFSGWDQYRSQLQLVTLLRPDIASDMAQSLLNQANQLGCWSRWTHNSGAIGVMNGDPSAAAIADIHAFGGRNFDIKGAYASLLREATIPREQRSCSRQSLKQWTSLHYFTPSVGSHDNSVANTLEYSAADFALAQLAKYLNHPSDFSMLMERSQNWKNLFNPQATLRQGYLQSKNAAGLWEHFDPESGEGFVEGTGAQYLWLVPFNEHALFERMGGDKAACKRLDEFFHFPDGSWAFHAGGMHPGMDNEPSIEVPWLYDYCREPFKTQQTVSVIRHVLWNQRPDGIPGNDDLGEMSSWYVWAALGLYPEIPGRAELLLTSPLFRHATIHRAIGNITITGRASSPSADYIQSVHLNGRLWKNSWLPPSFLEKPEHLSFELVEKPDRHWGVVNAEAPPSFNH